GAVLMISHDRAFVRALADRVFVLDPRGGRMFDGGFDQYVARVAEEARSEVKPRSTGSVGVAPRPAEPATATGKIRNPQMFARLEEEIFAMEDELREVREAMAREEVWRDPAKLKEHQAREQELQARLAVAYERWENW
ncbi:MAG TPA: hypothetical protein VK081_01810, partial [Planctomycetota bacterium]|nr:hypothetical protein [Planctomycetota bacterium]